MSEEIVVRQAAPTLAGIKTGSLFPYPCSGKKRLLDEIRAFNRRFAAKGLCLLPLRYSDGQALLYLYRPSALARDLLDARAAALLTQAGYPDGSCGQHVVTLIYPPEDVKGFIDNHAANSKCAGVWKVYGDEQRARQTFEKYKKCTQIYCDLWRSGSGLDQLAVAG